MCERYVLPDKRTVDLEFQPDLTWWKFRPRFNCAAHQYLPAVRLHEDKSEGIMMRWGFIPAWAEGKATAGSPTNIAADDIADSMLFGAPWLAGRRCIVPAGGFYTWRLTASRHRQPYFVRLTDRSAFGMAAIWDRSVTEEDDVIESFAIILVAANELLRETASSSPWMPAILRRRDYHTWLRGSAPEARAALISYRPQGMLAHAVSPRVNSTAHDDANLVLPVRSGSTHL